MWILFDAQKLIVFHVLNVTHHNDVLKRAIGKKPHQHQRYETSNQRKSAEWRRRSGSSRKQINKLHTVQTNYKNTSLHSTSFPHFRRVNAIWVAASASEPPRFFVELWIDFVRTIVVSNASRQVEPTERGFRWGESERGKAWLKATEICNSKIGRIKYAWSEFSAEVLSIEWEDGFCDLRFAYTLTHTYLIIVWYLS